MSQVQDDTQSLSDTPNPSPAVASPERRPWVTWGMSAVCVVVFVGLAQETDPDTWDALSRWGAPPSNEVWCGAYWGLFTNALVHRAFWHLAFNLYWLWALGKRLERAIGSGWYLVFVLTSGVVSSASQLGASEQTGIGASGIVYAIFGFMLVARSRFPTFQDILSKETIQLFLFWLVGCMVVTYAGMWHVGNAAHLSGLLLGALLAGCFAIRYKPRLLLAGLLGLVAVCLLPLFWCPWSATWLSTRGFLASEAGDDERAIRYYNRVIELDPNSAWAYYNRGLSYLTLNDCPRAESDFKKACQLDSSYQMPEELK